MDRIYFEVNEDGVVIRVTDYEISSSDGSTEIITVAQSDVHDPYDMIGRNISELDMNPRPDRQPGTIIPSAPSKLWFDRLKIAQAELSLVTSLELTSEIEKANLNVNSIKSEFQSKYEPGDNILSPTGLEEEF